MLDVTIVWGREGGPNCLVRMYCARAPRWWPMRDNPRQHQSGTSIDRATRISKIGNAVLRAALYMPALSAMR